MMHLELGRPGRAASASFRRAALPRGIAGIGAVLAFLCVCVCASPVRAQSIVAVVNGTAITSVDIEQRIKLLHILHKNATRDVALQSIIDDNLKLDETNKFKIKAGDAEIGQEIAKSATALKTTPQALMASMHAAGISDQHIRDHFASRFTFHTLMSAYHKGVDVSDTLVRTELSKEAGSPGVKEAETEYVVRQVVFALPATSNAEKVTGRIHQAEQLRTRFTDCASGLPMARGMDDVAVKEEIRRNGAQLSQSLRGLLDKTETGHLTPPQRTSEGIEMLAVCSKSATKDKSAARAAVAERLQSEEVDAEGEKKLQELRSRAVIVKK